jgi:exosortase A-associated hydrolase 2
MTPTDIAPPLVEPRFLDFNGRRLFTLHWRPTGPCTGAVLYLPPYAEEMNRCRSHVAAQARALAASGRHCLLLDHFGTGESEGLSTEADWDLWLADAEAAANWLHAQTGLALTVWGLRTGALLAAELAAGGRVGIERLLFWQPVVDGKQYVNQYLRLRIASQMVHGAERETTSSIFDRLKAGENVEIAGYPLPGRLAVGMAARRMAGMDGLARLPIDWIEVVGQAGQGLPPASQRLVEGLVAGGARVRTATAVAPMFWQLAGNQMAPELQSVTSRMMEEAS